MRTHPAVTNAVALIVLSIATCTCHAASPKACDLLSAQAAASLLPGTVGAPQDFGGILCVYMAKGGASAASLSLTDAPAAASINIYNAVKASYGKSATESIPGLGEQNFLFVQPSNKNGLTVLYHQKIVVLNAQVPMTPTVKSALIQTMKQILPRL